MPVIWDVTVVCTYVDSYVEAWDRETGAAAELPATCKMQWRRYTRARQVK